MVDVADSVDETELDCFCGVDYSCIEDFAFDVFFPELNRGISTLCLVKLELRLVSSALVRSEFNPLI